MEYFKFEEDFMEENVRCIPMVVRFKMDLAGIKLKLGEWGRFHPTERIELALLPISTAFETEHYRNYLGALVTQYTGQAATPLSIDQYPEWNNIVQLPEMLKEKSSEIQVDISISQWQRLSNIQRFALLKLCRTGHENKNFPKAVAEFGLMDA
ncbi:MAG: nitrate reductase associated protein [Pedobacter sp.]|nr:nitrate reductase associated protein [Pedobacter sp.]